MSMRTFTFTLQRAVRAALATTALLLTFDASPAELGPAPLYFEAQGTTGWTRNVAPKAAKSRADVAALYHSVYQSGNTIALTWNGSVAACNPGSTNIEHQQAVIARVNYYRALVDLPALSLLSGAEVGQEQAAALMLSANNALSHSPPTSWFCYTASGATGAGSSNIALGARGVAAIDLYMDDPGAGNEPVGHRRWVLFPPRTAMATGDVPGGNSPPRPTNALYVLGPSGARPATPMGIAWPPAGYVPYQNLPSQSKRWSIAYPGASFANAKVTLTGPNGPLAVSYEAPANGFGDNTLVFLPAGVAYGKPSVDSTYNITVTGISGSGVPSTLEYSTIVIDPDATPPAAATVDVIEYYNAALDHYFITWAPAEIANLDAARTPTPWTRTGTSFKAYTSSQPGTSPVCRYYIPPNKGDSHFFGRGTAECAATGAIHPDFVLEQTDFMYVYLPIAGACPVATVPVYRVFSNRPDANHRYMIDRSVRDQMSARGWMPEGDGPDMVVMCAPG